MTKSTKREPSAIGRLLASVAYLRIKHPVKFQADWVIPVPLAAVTVIGIVLLPVQPAILGDKGFLHGVHDLIGLLAAFFVAALAAVATFDRPTLDEPMLGKAPTLDKEPLTRRRFVCYLFGYLSVLAFFLFFASVAIEIVAPSLHVLFSAFWLRCIRVVCGSAYAVAFWNMISTTLLGIWFLVERVHLQSPKDEAVPVIGKRAA